MRSVLDMLVGSVGTGSTFLVGTDGSAPALAAVRFTEGLGRATGAEVTLASVPDDGPAACALCELADRQRAALVAVGAPHRYGFGRLKPGGVVDQLLQRSPHPILVVGPANAGLGVRAVGVAQTGDGDSETALAFGAAMASGLGAELRLVGVVEPGPAGVHGHDELRESRRADHERRLDEQLGRLEAGIQARVRSLVGHTGTALVRESDALDLLIVDSPRACGGGASLHVVAQASCPVLVMPRPANLAARVA